MIDRGKRSKTLSEVKPVENRSKNLQNILEKSPLLHVGTKLSPFDSKEISASLRFRLDKLTTFLLTKLPFNLFSKSKT